MPKIKNILQTVWQNPKYSMPAILLLWGAVYFFLGAVINRNNGLGFDGATYGTIVKNFYDVVLNDKLTHYQIQRVLPLFVVNLILTVLNLPKEDFFIIKVFQVYNLILLIFCTFLWYKISGIYKLDLKYVWLGYVFAFLNFGIAEITFYYPVLTDTTAFFLGFCLLYFHLKNNLPGKLLITFLGAFTWPSFIYAGILLIIFPVNSVFDFSFSIEQKKKSLKVFLALLVPLMFFAVSIYNVNKYFSGESFYDIFTPVFASLLYIDSVLNLLFMTYMFYIFLPDGLSLNNIYSLLKKIVSRYKVKNILLALGIFLVIHLIQKNLSNDMDTGVSFSLYVYYIAIYGITKPFVYFVTSVTYLGPCFIILFFFLKNYKQHIFSLGIGVYLSFTMTFVLLFLSETRAIINYFPFIVLLSVLVLKDFNPGRNIFVLLCVFSLLLSKIFIPMENVPVENAIRLQFFDFPNQLFFMNSYTISKLAYFIQGSVILIMSVIIIVKLKKCKVTETNSRKDLLPSLSSVKS